MKALLASLVLATALAGQTAMAHVNDARSHGAVGDAFLSLDEAIRLLNQQLTLTQLSAAERMQIMGTGTLTMIVLEAAVTPLVTLERVLTPVDGPPSHDSVHIEGSGTAGTPVLVVGNLDVGLRLRTNHAHVHGLTIRGGHTGVAADSSVHMHPGESLELMDLTFDGQTEAGLRLLATSTLTDVMLMRALFTNQATAIAVDDRAGNTGVMLMARDVQFRLVQLGVDIVCDADGGTTMCEIYHAQMTSSQQFARCRRFPTGSRRVMLMLRACDIETTADAVDMQGNAVGETLFHHHHCTLHPGAARRAIYLWPQDARFDLHGSENVVYGHVDVAAGRLSRRLWTWNSIFRQGTLTISNSGTRPSLRWNRFENCTIRAAAGNSTQLALASSEFYGCTFEGLSAVGPIVVDNSWLAKTLQSGAVQIYNPAPSPWLGQSAASTSTPRLGSTVDLTLDLPAGMAGVWHLGLGDPVPLLTEEPWRFYALRDTLVPLPGVFVLRSTLRLPIPAIRSLAGVEFYAQPVTAPYLGQTHVPAFNLPRGAYLTPQAP